MYSSESRFHVRPLFSWKFPLYRNRSLANQVPNKPNIGHPSCGTNPSVIQNVCRPTGVEPWICIQYDISKVPAPLDLHTFVTTFRTWKLTFDSERTVCSRLSQKVLVTAFLLCSYRRFVASKMSSRRRPKNDVPVVTVRAWGARQRQCSASWCKSHDFRVSCCVLSDHLNPEYVLYVKKHQRNANWYPSAKYNIQSAEV